MKSKLRVTQSLLSAWEWSFLKEEGGYEDFLSALRREKKPPTKQMLEGVRFENCVNAVLDGEKIGRDHEWYAPVTELADKLRGAQKQVTVFRDFSAAGVDWLLHGVFDFLKAGVIYDTKYSKSYYINKYLNSVQHPMYFALCLEARRFEYLVSDGKFIYTESYFPEDILPITAKLGQFKAYLEAQGLWELYVDKWATKGAR